MLFWLGCSAAWHQRSFWTPENLMASVFFGANSIRGGFAWHTFSGLALYLAIYILLGGLVGLVLRDRLPRLRTLLVSMAFAVAWYYASFRWLWKGVMPLVWLLHAERATMVGHLIYGALLGRFPAYLERGATEPVTPSPARFSSPPDPA